MSDSPIESTKAEMPSPRGDDGKAKATSEAGLVTATEAGEVPSLTDVLAWHNTVALHIANYAPIGAKDDAAFHALVRLRDLARLALDRPTPGQLREGILNDPYCHAAYAEGQRQGFEAAREEYYGA